ncbi:hypothetical protein Tco_0689830 [Tanacetum coccineum]
MAARVVLMKTGLRPLNTARPVNTAHSKTTVYSAKPMLRFSKSVQSTVKRPYQIKSALTNKNFSQKVNTGKGRFFTARPKAVNTARPKAVNTARPNSAVVNVVRENQVNAVKALACWVWRPTKLDSASTTLKKHNYVDARGRSKILDNGEMEITATIDGKVKIVSKASIRRHLKLEDSDGISNLPTTEIFEQLALMRQESMAPQPRSHTQTNVADESASTGVDVRHGGDATTVTILDAGQGSGNIDNTPTMPYDSPLPRVHTLGSDEGTT